MVTVVMLLVGKGCSHKDYVSARKGGQDGEGDDFFRIVHFFQRRPVAGDGSTKAANNPGSIFFSLFHYFISQSDTKPGFATVSLIPQIAAIRSQL